MKVVWYIYYLYDCLDYVNIKYYFEILKKSFLLPASLPLFFD